MFWDFLYENAGTISLVCVGVLCIGVVCFFTCGAPIVVAGVLGGVFLAGASGFGGIFYGRETANRAHRHEAQVALEGVRAGNIEMQAVAREAVAANPQPALAELAVLGARIQNLQEENNALRERMNARDAIDDAARINMQRQIEELRAPQLQRHGLYRRVPENDANIDMPVARGRGRGNNL